ncbi:MAG: hypothetical protein H6Q04_1296 [Acidobacteria bacterium]|jgi:hypothetical protein|nr:hypothetical protein [Acidobacteriota bacterium]
MREQTAILVQDQNQWIFIAEDNSEKVWKDFDAAMKALERDGWQVVKGPAPIRLDSESDAFDRLRPWGYSLRRRIQ